MMILALGLCVTVLLAESPVPASPRCTNPGNGSGSVDLPPLFCAYDDDTDTFKIIDGLPPGTELRSDGLLQSFFDILRSPGTRP